MLFTILAIYITGVILTGRAIYPHCKEYSKYPVNCDESWDGHKHYRSCYKIPREAMYAELGILISVFWPLYFPVKAIAKVIPESLTYEEKEYLKRRAEFEKTENLKKAELAAECARLKLIELGILKDNNFL